MIIKNLEAYTKLYFITVVFKFVLDQGLDEIDI